MQKTQKIAAIVIVLAAVLTAYGFWRTGQALPTAPAGANQSAVSNKSLVDQSTSKTAQRLAQLATTREERALAQEALRLADYDVDLAFDNALREARLHPPSLSAEAKEAEARLQKGQNLLKADQERGMDLSERLAKVAASKKEALEGDIVQNQADLELDKDEVDDAKEDLIRAGGDLTDRIQDLKKKHDEASHGLASVIPTGPEPAEEAGLIHRAMQWRELHQKQLQLWQAKTNVEKNIAVLSAKHNALDAQIESEKASVPELAQHSKKTAALQVSAAGNGQTDAASLLKKTQQIADDQKILSTYDKRIETKKELASVYGQWIDLVATQQRSVVHRALIGIAVILVIALIGLFFGSWMDSLIQRLPMDRRQVQSLHTVIRVGLQIAAVALILLVIFGPPGQLGTFLGLAGAGLTVALKDFIVGFLGWFVLMGKNGMHLGDWVEINGVTGEIVEIGPFHTVLMETGNWTDSGHPTGRRVTFTNSFAIEGHYFNFSTSGQWLWDELQIVLPAGQDPYPMLDAIHKKVIEATQATAEQAKQEWQGASGSRELGGISVAPAVSVKPVVGGVEVAVRYITRASERYELRAKLNQAAVEILGGRAAPVSS
jgi:small-conductance mechanosensitive channel